MLLRKRVFIAAPPSLSSLHFAFYMANRNWDSSYWMMALTSNHSYGLWLSYVVFLQGKANWVALVSFLLVYFPLIEECQSRIPPPWHKQLKMSDQVDLSLACRLWIILPCHIFVEKKALVHPRTLRMEAIVSPRTMHSTNSYTVISNSKLNFWIQFHQSNRGQSMWVSLTQTPKMPRLLEQ